MGGGWALEFKSFCVPREMGKHPKHYAQGCINHRCIGGFMHKKPTREVSGPILWGVEEQVNKGT